MIHGGLSRPRFVVDDAATHVARTVDLARGEVRESDAELSIRADLQEIELAEGEVFIAVDARAVNLTRVREPGGPPEIVFRRPERDVDLLVAEISGVERRLDVGDLARRLARVQCAAKRCKSQHETTRILDAHRFSFAHHPLTRRLGGSA